MIAPTVIDEVVLPEGWTKADYAEYLDIYRQFRHAAAVIRRRQAISLRARRTSDLRAAAKWSQR